MTLPPARNPRLVLHAFVTELCRCGEHPRTVLVADVLRSWIRGRRVLLGLDPQPESITPMPAWARYAEGEPHGHGST